MIQDQILQRFYKRWFTLPMVAQQHAPQVRLANSPARHNVIAAGRRSFKSEREKRKVIIGNAHQPGALSIPDGRFFYAAPTHQQAKEIAWQDLKDMTGPYWKGRPHESDRVISLNNGGRIYVFGMEEPARAEGQRWHGGVLDEYGNMKPEVWTLHLQPVTADTGAWIDFVGVPEGRNHYYNLAQKAARGQDPNWAYHTWHTADAGAVPPEEIAKAKEELDERSYRQEYEGEFLTGGRAVYYSFTANNLRHLPFLPDAKTFLCWDFNATVKPLAVIVVQLQPDGTYHAVHEFVTPYTQTATAAERAKDWLLEHGFTGSLHCRGDYAGHSQKSSATVSDWVIVENAFKNFRGFDLVTKPTRKIKDRITALNSLLLNANGQMRLTVDSVNCPKLVRDLEQTEWKSNEYELDDRDPERTHPTDALSYFAHAEHPTNLREVTTSYR